MDAKLLEILVCPLCKGKLLHRKEQRDQSAGSGLAREAPEGGAAGIARHELICKADRLAYPIRDDIPVMLENEARRIELDELDALP